MKAKLFLMAILAILLITPNAMATSFGDLDAGTNITINDTIWNSNASQALGQGGEDNETEKTASGISTIATQVWDMEAIYWNASNATLTIFGGFDFINGVDHGGTNYEIGDLFVGNFESPVYSPSGASPFSPGYAIDFSRSSSDPDNDSVGGLEASGTFGINKGPFSVENTSTVTPLSDPWLYVSGGTTFGDGGTYKAGTVTGSPLNGWGLNDTHYYLQLSGLDELGSIAVSESILHITMQCGNDSVRAAPVPEPTTFLLSGLGLLGMGCFLRRKFKKA